MRVAHLKAFWIMKIGFTGMGTKIIQTTAKRISRRTLNQILINTIPSRMWDAKSSGM